MLLLKVFAAFCAAEKTLEKKPLWGFGFGVVDPFSGVGVNGADVIFDNLLGPNGPNADEVDRTLRCEIMFPEGDVMTLGFDDDGSDDPRSRLLAKRGVLESVGVGGVFTIIGAVSPWGGVCGTALVSIGWTLFVPVRGRSGEEFNDGCGDCLSGNIAPILDATLPRLSAVFFSFCNCSTAAALRSGLGVGLGPRRAGLRASFNLRPGEGDRFCDPSVGVLRVVEEMSVGADSGEARLSDV
jgi:hypothetical protein